MHCHAQHGTAWHGTAHWGYWLWDALVLGSVGAQNCLRRRLRPITACNACCHSFPATASVPTLSLSHHAVPPPSIPQVISAGHHLTSHPILPYPILPILPYSSYLSYISYILYLSLPYLPPQVISAVSSLGTASLDGTPNHLALSFPLLISAAGILVCIVTTFIATDLQPAKQVSEVEHTLKMQLIISTTLMTPVAYALAASSLPASFTLAVPSSTPGQTFDIKEVKWWWVGLAAGGGGCTAGVGGALPVWGWGGGGALPVLAKGGGRGAVLACQWFAPLVPLSAGLVMVGRGGGVVRGKWCW